MSRTWTIEGSGGTPRSGAAFIKMIHAVNTCAKNAGQDPVFGQPEIKVDETYHWEHYPRASVRITLDPHIDYSDNDRVCVGIDFFVDDNDKQLQAWLEAARAAMDIKKMSTPRFAEAYWSSSDLAKENPTDRVLSHKEALDFFDQHDRRIHEAMIAAGWDKISELLENW